MTITEIKEAICDNYCKYPFNTETQADLNEHCKECPLNELSDGELCDHDCEHCIWTECPIEPCEDDEDDGWIDDEYGRSIRLEQNKTQVIPPLEPCEDAVSRDAVLKGIEELKKSPWCTDKRGGYEYLITEALDTVKDLCVKPLPSVTLKESE